MRAQSLFFKAALILGAGLGVALNLAASPGQLAARLSYYTIQSNLLVACFFTFVLALTARGRSAQDAVWYPPARLALTVSIALTGLVYHCVLVPAMSGLLHALSFNPDSLGNWLVHTLVPVGVAADYLLFDRKGRYRPVYCLWGAVPPLLYLVYVAIYVSAGGRFMRGLGGGASPYFFLDLEQYGLSGVALWCGALLAGILALGAALAGLDCALGRRQGSRI